MREPEVVFNMDLANGLVSERFCYEAMYVLGTTMSNEDADHLSNRTEFESEVVDDWTGQLENAGYYVWWNAGDVVVFDLRPLTDDEREEFYKEMENM
jgi:hypothetical protein